MPTEPQPFDGPVRKELTECNHCFKSRLQKGVRLSKCSGCKHTLYCVQSTECQKAAWPLHKLLCKSNQRSIIENADIDRIKPLRAFTSKHASSIAQYGLCAFDLANHPKRYLDQVLRIRVTARPGLNRPELSYIALDAGLSPLSFFEDKRADEIRQQMKDWNEEGIKYGCLGSVWIVLHDVESALVNIAPIGFDRDDLENEEMRDPSWKENLLLRLTSGIVV